MTAAIKRSSGTLRVARRLAKTLLESAGAGDAPLEIAFHSFRSLLAADDVDACRAAGELADFHQTSRPEPYFLELLLAAESPTTRKKHGVYFTPGPVVDYLVRRVEELVPAGPLRIVDPACGGGVFLLAAAELARRRPGSSLVGFDLSATAVGVTKELLRDASVPVHIEQTNPLLAGDDLAPLLLSPPARTPACPPALIVLGNPPYANYGRLNRGTWIDALTAEYRRGLDEQKLNLTDDFIKFLRWGQFWLDRVGRGVLAVITSRTYLSGVTHRGMRRSLMESFPQIEIVDLHGDGEPGDENVFSIRRGVAIGVFSSVGQASCLSRSIVYNSLRGTRAEKLDALRGVLPACHNLSPVSPGWLFVPPAKTSHSNDDDYLSWPRLDEIFIEFISGVQTKNDALFVDFDRDCLAERLQQRLGGFEADLIRPYVVGPFDRRWIYYDPQLLGRARWPVMRHLVEVPDNVALVFMRQSTTTDVYDHALVVDSLASDRVFYSRRGAPFVAPLWRGGEQGGRRASGQAGNFNESWVANLAERIGFRPENDALFAYLYAILHAPAYHHRYLAELQRDFPRIPWPSGGGRFDVLVRLGRQLIELHLSFSGSSSPLEVVGDSEPLIVERGYPRLRDNVVGLNSRAGLRLHDPIAWEFRVGGHRVVQRWLQVRQGRPLSEDDLRYVAWLTTVATQTSALTAKIDLTACL